MSMSITNNEQFEETVKPWLTQIESKPNSSRLVFILDLSNSLNCQLGSNNFYE